MYERYGKRLLDIILSLAATIILAIPMGLVALWIKLDSPGPVFFKQRRVGKGKTHFNILKFRTMRGDTPHDVPTHLLKDADSYITGSGAFLRKTSLDELPQIYNVLRGQMSLVGPRPPLPEEVAAYKPWHQQRLAVVGGLTGLWQVSGRSDLTFDELCLLDIYYIENWSLGLDVRILLQTIPHLLSRKGAY